MLSVLVNTSLQPEPILINDFSRLAPLITSKFNGPQTWRCMRMETRSNATRQPLYTYNQYPVNYLLRSLQRRRNEESISHLVRARLSHTNKHSNCFYNEPTCLRRVSSHRGDKSRDATTGEGEDAMSRRFWEKTGAQPEGFTFSIMSYNVLAQDLLEQHSYLYSRHHRDSLAWNTRWRNLYAEIAQFLPDILCLQEVQKSHLDQYYSHLAPLGYLRIYKQRTGIRTDGCAIFYKHALLNLVEHTTVEFKQTVGLLNRDNVGIVAKFSPGTRPDQEFIVATTHLLYNPNRQDVRLAQTQVLLAEIERFAYKRGQYLPVLLTGDFNSAPNSAVIRFITSARLHYENLTARSLENAGGHRVGKTFLPPNLRITDSCQHADLLPGRGKGEEVSRAVEGDLIGIKHSEWKKKAQKSADDNRVLFSSGTLRHLFGFRSVYSHFHNGDPEATTYQDAWVSVDYIFYSSMGQNGSLALLERFTLPTRSHLGNATFPNPILGSDHLCLIAKFKLH